MNIEALRFPIGKYVKPEKFTNEIIQQYLDDISSFPERLKKEVIHLNDEQLDTEYRPNGWSIRQVVHHCADSHMNAFIRFKL
ncbi:MAG: metal-dependent hydrolase, partial [Bacteroidia bacterium]|nr:metal-dependent hydrolase [Bacteroidia bacterium]